jgi:hypothetical protein
MGGYIPSYTKQEATYTYAVCRIPPLFNIHIVSTSILGTEIGHTDRGLRCFTRSLRTKLGLIP